MDGGEGDGFASIGRLPPRPVSCWNSEPRASLPTTCSNYTPGHTRRAPDRLVCGICILRGFCGDPAVNVPASLQKVILTGDTRPTAAC